MKTEQNMQTNRRGKNARFSCKNGTETEVSVPTQKTSFVWKGTQGKKILTFQSTKLLVLYWTKDGLRKTFICI